METETNNNASPREEWQGQRSHKWSSSRKHVAPPGAYGENVKEKIFSGTVRSTIARDRNVHRAAIQQRKTPLQGARLRPRRVQVLGQAHQA